MTVLTENWILLTLSINSIISSSFLEGSAATNFIKSFTSLNDLYHHKYSSFNLQVNRKWEKRKSCFVFSRFSWLYRLDQAKLYYYILHSRLFHQWWKTPPPWQYKIKVLGIDWLLVWLIIGDDIQYCFLYADKIN